MHFLRVGTTYSYNNAGYVLLTEIVKRLSGKSFADFLSERILRPVGMHDTMLRPLDTDLVPNSATLHVPSPDGGWTRGVFGMPVGGEGGIVSTVDDMLLWLRHMSHPTVGSPATWAAMRTPVTTHGYGLGLHMSEYRGLRTVHHAGSVVGGSSQMVKVVDHDLDVMIMSNGRSTLDLLNLVDAIIDACIPGLPPKLPEAAGGAPASGTFHSPGTGRVLTMVEHEGKQAVAMGGMTLPTWCNEDGALSIEIPGIDLRITPVRAGEAVVALEVEEAGSHDRLERIDAPADATAMVQAGRFENASAGVTATITHDPEGTATLQLTCEVGAVDYALTPIGPDLWEAKATSTLPLVVTLEFDADVFRLTTGRTARLRFRRS